MKFFSKTCINPNYSDVCLNFLLRCLASEYTQYSKPEEMNQAQNYYIYIINVLLINLYYISCLRVHQKWFQCIRARDMWHFRWDSADLHAYGRVRHQRIRLDDDRKYWWWQPRIRVHRRWPLRPGEIRLQWSTKAAGGHGEFHGNAVWVTQTWLVRHAGFKVGVHGKLGTEHVSVRLLVDCIISYL